MSAEQPWERFGKGLFGRPVRLQLLAWIARSGDRTFYLKEAAESTGAATSALHQELVLLVGLGMLQRLEAEGSRRVYYQRVASPWWGVADAAATAMEETSESVDQPHRQNPM